LQKGIYKMTNTPLTKERIAEALNTMTRLTSETFDDKAHADAEFGSTLAYYFETIRAALELAERMQWQPIETILKPDHPNFRQYNAKFLADIECETGYPVIAGFLFCLHTFQYMIVDCETGEQINPTRWMPLLPAPAQEGGV